jgi:hypothetical protein
MSTKHLAQRWRYRDAARDETLAVFKPEVVKGFGLVGGPAHLTTSAGGSLTSRHHLDYALMHADDTDTR